MAYLEFSNEASIGNHRLYSLWIGNLFGYILKKLSEGVLQISKQGIETELLKAKKLTQA